MKLIKSVINQWSTYKGLFLALAAFRPELAVGVEVVDAALSVVQPVADVVAVAVIGTEAAPDEVINLTGKVIR